MPQPRGQANQALYRARILLQGWELSLARDSRAAEAVDRAYRPAVQAALGEAYGWFLMVMAGIEDPSEPDPPRRCADLPAPETGLASAPELHEFAQLEREGWLGQMLADYRFEPGAACAYGSPGRATLLGSDRQAPGHALVARWADRLQATMARMDDSLSEC